MASDSAGTPPSADHALESARLALSLFNQKRYADALPLLEQLLASGNTPLPCALALAGARENTGDGQGAIRLLQGLYAVVPREDIAVYLAAALMRAGEPELFGTELERLVAAHPANKQLLGLQAMHALKSGDYATGFDLHGHRWALTPEQPITAPLPCPAWSGEPFAGTLLVGTEQGIGEAVLWSSVFGDIEQLGQDALVACDARLLPLFRRSFRRIRFVDRTDAVFAETARRPGSRKIESVDLGRLFRRDRAAFPARQAWLVADEDRTRALRAEYHARFPGKRLIGLAWASRRDLVSDSKSIPIADLAPLLREPDTVFVSLQYGDINDDLAALRQLGLALHVDPHIDTTGDIDGVCALAAAMDGVVSSSNTMAHLAGALGLPVRTMLPGTRYVLWYWGYDGATIPWYPSMHIFRGPPRKSWRDLAMEVAADIRSGSVRR